MTKYYVYIMASKRNGTLYIGVTNDLLRRVVEHKEDVNEGFTKKYQVHDLVYYASTPSKIDAISLEKAMKKWERKWKLRQIEELNPDWIDLYPGLVEETSL